jgi:hypothetical protein
MGSARGRQTRGETLIRRIRATPDQEVIDRERHLVHEWRVAQLVRLGIAETLAEVDADNVDWHQIARLVRCGCPPRLALRIAR